MYIQSSCICPVPSHFVMHNYSHVHVYFKCVLETRHRLLFGGGILEEIAISLWLQFRPPPHGNDLCWQQVNLFTKEIDKCMGSFLWVQTTMTTTLEILRMPFGWNTSTHAQESGVWCWTYRVHSPPIGVCPSTYPGLVLHGDNYVDNNLRNSISFEILHHDINMMSMTYH